MNIKYMALIELEQSPEQCCPQPFVLLKGKRGLVPVYVHECAYEWLRANLMQL